MSDSPTPAAHARVSLRAQLGGTPDPDFQLLLPPGWERRPVDDAERDAMVSAMRSRLMSVHRPELFARMRQLVDEAFAQMRTVSTVAMFLPATEDALQLPASLTASIQHADPGQNLDAYVRSAITRGGAEPLLGDKRFLRMERESTQSIDGDTVAVSTLAYLSPVPGSQRRRALLLTAVIMRPHDVAADAEPVVAMKALFDLCASTLSWVPAAA